MLTSHLGPANPMEQSHLNDPGVLTQVPPCSHGLPLSRHSSMSCVQSMPLKPKGHEHIYVPSMGEVSQIAPTIQWNTDLLKLIFRLFNYWGFI
jgi:hypothetical protein